MGNQINFCSGGNTDNYEQEIVQGKDVILSPPKLGNRRSYYDSEEGVYVRFVIN